MVSSSSRPARPPVAREAAPEVAPTSREYLWGVSMRGEDGGSGGEYKSWWAHDAAEERAACVFLHARSYAGPGWAFSTDEPAWAAE